MLPQQYDVGTPGGVEEPVIWVGLTSCVFEDEDGGDNDDDDADDDIFQTIDFSNATRCRDFEAHPEAGGGGGG